MTAFSQMLGTCCSACVVMVMFFVGGYMEYDNFEEYGEGGDGDVCIFISVCVRMRKCFCDRLAIGNYYYASVSVSGCMSISV